MLQDVNKQRLDKVLSIIKAKSIRFPVAEISKRLGGDKGNISAYLNGKKPMSDNFYTTFINEFGGNKDDIIYRDDNKIESNAELLLDYIPKLSEYIDAVKEKNRILEESKQEIAQSKKDLKEMNDRLFAMLETSVKEIKPSLVSLSDRQHVLAAEIMAGFDRAAEIEAKGDKVKEQEKMRRVYELIAERLPAHLKKGKTAVPGN